MMSGSPVGLDYNVFLGAEFFGISTGWTLDGMSAKTPGRGDSFLANDVRGKAWPTQHGSRQLGSHRGPPRQSSA
jgi:hypothetical protein